MGTASYGCADLAMMDLSDHRATYLAIWIQAEFLVFHRILKLVLG